MNIDNLLNSVMHFFDRNIDPKYEGGMTFFEAVLSLFKRGLVFFLFIFAFILWVMTGIFSPMMIAEAMVDGSVFGLVFGIFTGLPFWGSIVGIEMNKLMRSDKNL